MFTNTKIITVFHKTVDPEKRLPLWKKHVFQNVYWENCLAQYDTLLGDNASGKIFANIKDNIRKYDEIYTSLLDFIAKQSAVSSNRMNEISKKYAPKRLKKL